MSNLKFNKTLLSASLASILIPSAFAVNIPVDITEVTFVNDGFINNPSVKHNITATNTEFENKGFIKNTIFDFSEITPAPATNGKILNKGTIYNHNVTVASLMGRNSTFLASGTNFNRDVINYGNTSSLEHFLHATGNYSLNNYGKTKAQTFISGVNTPTSHHNYGSLNTIETIHYGVKNATLDNYGVVVTRGITNNSNAESSVSGPTTYTYNNYGITVAGGNVKVYSGPTKTFMLDGQQMTVINGTQSASNNNPTLNSASNGTSFNNNIVNAHTYTLMSSPVRANPTSDFKNSIINTGINFDLDPTTNATINVNNSIYNGSYDNEVKLNVIGNNTTTNLNFTGKSMINGDLTYATTSTGVTNNLNIADSVMLNANVDGGANSTNNLTITAGGSNVKVFHNVSNLNTFNLKGNATLMETAKVTNVKIIDLQAGGSLTVRVDMANKSSTGEASVTSLAGNNGLIKSTGGKLIIDAFPVSDTHHGDIVNFGGTKLDNSIFTDNKIEASHALVNVNAVFKQDPSNSNKVIVSLKENLPGNKDPNNPYEVIYEAMKQSGQIVNMVNTSKEEPIYWTLEQIYSANPYGYTMKSAVDSLKLFKKNTDYNTIMPKANQRLASVRLIYTGDMMDNYASGKGHYSEQNLKTTSNTVGVLVNNEYGLTDNHSLGINVGYSKKDTSFKGLSNIKSDNLYAGVFMKNNFGNLHTKIGVDYQYTAARVKHDIVNAQDSFSNKEAVNNNALGVSLEGKYNFSINDNFTIAPVFNTAFYRIFQDAVDEGNGRLATKVDSTAINLVDIGAGLDFSFRTQIFNGSLKQILHAGVIGTLGNTEKTIYASFIGVPNRYGIKTVAIPKAVGKLGYKFEYEAFNNFIYSFGGGYEVGKDMQSFDANLGLGYKF